MLLSIITVNKNNADGLAATLQSVAEQTFPQLEQLVIDGLSSDNSMQVVKHFENGISYHCSESDSGIYEAMNKGIEKAKGEYLLFLNSGDTLYSSTVLEEVFSQIDNKDLYYGNLLLTGKGGRLEQQAPAILDLDVMLNSTLWHPCTFIKRTLFEQLGYYNTDFKLAGDYEFFVRCFVKPGIRFQHVNNLVCAFDRSGLSNNPSNASLLSSERNKAWRMNVSDEVYVSLKRYNRFTRSKYYNVYEWLEKLRGRTW